MRVLTLVAQPISKAAFAPFGTLIELDGAESFSINQGTTTRYHALAEMDVASDQGKPILSIFRTNAWQRPIRIKMLERHPLGSQAFMPLNSGSGWIAVVANAENPQPEDCQAFVLAPNQGLQYRRNVWHHPLVTLVGPADFLVADRAGPGDNLEERFFESGECVIDLPFGEHAFERGFD